MPKLEPGSERIKVLFIIDELRRSGGAERALLKMIRLLPGERFQPLLATFRMDVNLDIIQDPPCPLYVFPLRRTCDANAFRTGFRLARLIRSERIDIVHTFFETSDLWAAPIARLSGVSVLISSRRDMGILRAFKHQLAYRLIGRIFEQTQAVSETVRQNCIRIDRLQPSRVVTVYNGVALARIDGVPAFEAARVRRELVAAGASHVITALGNIRRVKGFDILVRAAAAVRRRIPGALFIIAGGNYDPEYGRELSGVVREVGVSDCVRFLGGVPDPIPLLKASDVFCLPSRSEGLSNALLEAAACGVPAVATRVGGNPEIIEDGRSGYLVENEDADALAERITDLLDNSDRRAQMGRAARVTVEQRFSDERMIAQLVGEYENLLRASHNPAIAERKRSLPRR